MPDIEFDDFIAGLQRALAGVQAGFAAQALERLELLQQINAAGGTEALDWQMTMNTRGADGTVEKTMSLPLWSMRMVREVRLREVTLELPVTVEEGAEDRLAFVIRDSQRPHGSTLRLCWLASPDDSLTVSYDGWPVQVINGFLGHPSAEPGAVQSQAP